MEGKGGASMIAEDLVCQNAVTNECRQCANPDLPSEEMEIRARESAAFELGNDNENSICSVIIQLYGVCGATRVERKREETRGDSGWLGG